MYRFVFTSIDTPVEEIKKFFKKHDISYTLKNNSIFIMDLLTIVIHPDELLATRGLLIELCGNNMCLSTKLNTPTALKIKNVIHGWINISDTEL